MVAVYHRSLLRTPVSQSLVRPPRRGMSGVVDTPVRASPSSAYDEEDSFIASEPPTGGSAGNSFAYWPSFGKGIAFLQYDTYADSKPVLL